MKKLTITFDNNIQLAYNVLETKTANIWATFLEKASFEYLLQTDLNHRHGFASDEKILEVFTRLETLLFLFDETIEPLNSNNWNTVLNTAHEKFLNLHKLNKNISLKKEEMEINLCIHWLEYELDNKFNNSKQFMFNMDFNQHWKSASLTGSIQRNEYESFTPMLNFGSLHIHYNLIGRHFLEMANAKDMLCDSITFKPQRTFNPTCGFVFSEPQIEEIVTTRLQDYYNIKGGKPFFNYDFNDPLLSKGFFQVTVLENIESYQTFEERDSLRQSIKSATIVNWKLT